MVICVCYSVADIRWREAKLDLRRSALHSCVEITENQAIGQQFASELSKATPNIILQIKTCWYFLAHGIKTFIHLYKK